MRVLIISTSFPCAPGDPSGHFVRAEGERLVELGHDVHVVAPGAGYASGCHPDGGLTVHWAGGGTLFGWPGAAETLRRAPWRIGGLAAFAYGVRRHVARLGRFDALQAHWLVPTAWPVLATSTARSERLDLFAHGADVRVLVALPQAVRARLLAGWLSQGAYVYFAAQALRSRLLRALPTAIAEHLARSSGVRLPALLVPSRAELLEVVGPRAARLGLRDGEPLIMSAGRLVGAKGLDAAVDALARSPGRPRWLVVGDGPERARLADRCQAAKVDVVFAGQCPRDETLGLMCLADLLLHPSREEAAPCVVREARLLGLPVVACSAGDVALWAASDPGITVAPCHPHALAEVLAATLRAQREPSTGPRNGNGETGGDPDLLPGPLPRHAWPLDRVPSGSEE